MRAMLLSLTAALTFVYAGSASAQTVVNPAAPVAPNAVVPAPVPGTTGTVVAPSPGNTGTDPNVTIAPGPTGASTIQTNSATGGNASQPERAVPQGGSGK